MFTHTECTKCQTLHTAAASLEQGRQSVGIGRISPERVQAMKLREQAWACQDKSEGEYIAEQERQWQVRRAQLEAEGWVEVWDSEEREYNFILPRKSA